MKRKEKYKIENVAAGDENFTLSYSPQFKGG